jgi:hypothetical protein
MRERMRECVECGKPDAKIVMTIELTNGPMSEVIYVFGFGIPWFFCSKECAENYLKELNA